MVLFLLLLSKTTQCIDECEENKEIIIYVAVDCSRSRLLIILSIRLTSHIIEKQRVSSSGGKPTTPPRI
jgi:hypothetical protein